jgi:hypothetical protein
MRHALAWACFVIGLLNLTAAPPVSAYDNTTLHDWYAFRFSGVEGGKTVVGSGIMRFYIDAQNTARLEGRATLHGYSVGSCTGTIEFGLYKVNADGTGFFASNFKPDCAGQSGTVLNFDIVVVNSGNGFEMLSTVNGGRRWGTATRQSPGPFAAADMAGTFGFRVVSHESQFEQVLLGVLVLDGAGGLTGNVTIHRANVGTCTGSVIPLASTYGVNANGTGTLALGVRYDSPCSGTDLWFLSVAVVRPGRAFEMASSAQGLVSGTATRQEPQP